MPKTHTNTIGLMVTPKQLQQKFGLTPEEVEDAINHSRSATVKVIDLEALGEKA